MELPTPAWETALFKVFGLHKRRYDTRRLQVALRQNGHAVGRQRRRTAMRRRGEYYDNALPGTTQAESRWSRLKIEVLELREWPVFADLADQQVSVADCFNYYNHERRYSSIGYQTPYTAHQKLLQITALNCSA